MACKSQLKDFVLQLGVLTTLDPAPPTAQSLSKQQRGSVKDRLGFQSGISVDPAFM